MGKYNQLSSEQRAVLQHMYCQRFKIGGAKYSQQYMTDEIGVSQPTISRELKRNSTLNQPSMAAKRANRPVKRYNANTAQKIADKRKSNKYVKLFTEALEFFKKHAEYRKSLQHNLLDLIHDKNFGKYKIPCLRTLYNWYYKGLIGQFCVRYRKKRKNRKNSKTIMDKSIVKKSVHQREKNFGFAHNNFDHDFGHIDIDLIEGIEHKSHVLTMIERKSMLFYAFKVKSKSASDVNKMIRKGLDLYKSHAIIPVSICSDNGSEFSYFNVIENAYNIKWYYCDPYRSSQRACNERSNRDARIIYPKGTDFSHLSEKTVHSALKFVNTLRRLRLGGLTPIEYLLKNEKQA